ncbi:MAG: transposase [Candidatus Nitrosopolaris sp.]
MTYKFRIYPSKQQIATLEQTIETCRLLYNQSLEERLKDKGLKYFEQKRNLTQKRKTTSSLQRIHSQVLQSVISRLERAFQNYHRDKRRVGQPNFKRYGRYNSITYSQFGSFHIKENRLRLAFIDGLIKIRLHRIPIGTIKTCTIIRDIDRWFACFVCNDDADRVKTRNNKTASVDVGLNNWMILDNGELIDRPRFLDAAIKNIKRLQADLSRKKKGSRHWQKAKISLAKAWRKVRLQREDYCHKVTTRLAKRFQTIVFEKLSIHKMVKNHRLADKILDATWYKLRQLAAYKAEVVTVDPSNTTQRCSRCGLIPEKKIRLDVRIYNCNGCDLVIDRDHNAALNILKMGSERTHVEKKPLRKQASLMKRKAHML